MTAFESVFLQSPSILSLIGSSEFRHYPRRLDADKKIFTLQDFDRIIQTGSFKPEDLEFFKDGRWLDGELLTAAQSADSAFQLRELSKTKILNSLKAGYSLRLNEIQRYSTQLARFIGELSQSCTARVSLNAYFTLSGQSALAPHQDDQDIVVVQISGQKHWYLEHEATDGFQKNSPSLTLNSGDVLFIPRNMRHAASCTDAHSLHLTIGFSDRHWKDYLSHITSEEPLSQLLNGRISPDPSVRTRQLSLLAQALESALNQPEALEDYLHRPALETSETSLNEFFNLKDD